jgi:hypothetical protein
MNDAPPLSIPGGNDLWSRGIWLKLKRDLGRRIIRYQ